MNGENYIIKHRFHGFILAVETSVNFYTHKRDNAERFTFDKAKDILRSMCFPDDHTMEHIFQGHPIVFPEQAKPYMK